MCSTHKPDQTRVSHHMCACLQDNNKEWNKQLALECSKAGLRVLLVGAHQPPLRIGALRVLMAKTGLEKPCVCEQCR